MKKQPTAIITSDIELRAHRPICRTDDHWEAQSNKIKFIRDIQKRFGMIPLIDGGDLFDKKYKQYPNHYLVAWAIANLPSPIYTVPGNHDLPGKTIEKYSDSAMNVLEQAGVVKMNDFFVTKEGKKIFVHRIPWGEPVETKEVPKEGFHFKIVLIHAMVYDRDLPFPGCEGYEKNQLLRMFSNFDLIVCGHHHATFTGINRRTGTVLVNPGSLMRNDADQDQFKPSIFLWYAEENRIEQIFVPIVSGVVSREHLDEKAKTEVRLDAFIEKLGQQHISGINFELNLESALTKDLNKGIINKVWQYYEGRIK